jgi:nuclear transcription factor Y alpha
MAMKTFYLKEHEGSVHNPNGQLSTVPWWTAFGSQAVNGESCGLLKALPIEQPAGGGETATKLARMGTEQGLDKGNITQFTIFPGKSFSFSWFRNLHRCLSDCFVTFFFLVILVISYEFAASKGIVKLCIVLCITSGLQQFALFLNTFLPQNDCFMIEARDNGSCFCPNEDL